MNTKKILKIAVALLVILNMTLVFIMITNGKGNVGPKNEIIKKLNFDKAQINSYEILVTKHSLEVKTNRIKIKEIKNQLFNLLKEDDYSEKRTLIDNLQKLSLEVEHLNFSHFIDIKKLCREEQMEDFYNLTDELQSLFSKVKKK